MEAARGNIMVISHAEQTQKKEIFQQKRKASFKWESIPILNVFSSNLRLEAALHVTDAQFAKKIINSAKYSPSIVKKYTASCSYPGRFKRVYVSRENGERFFLPSQINDLMPESNKFLSTKKYNGDISLLKTKEGELLVTRSGTVGNCTIVTQAMAGGIFSDDVIRLTTKEPHHLGYLYAYLKSDVGKTLLKSSDYGAVIRHIEPQHLVDLSIPDAPALIQSHIHHLIMESFRLRDESNKLITQARSCFKDLLELQSSSEYLSRASSKGGLTSFSINVADLDQRLEANYHSPVTTQLTKQIHQMANRVLNLSSPELGVRLSLPSRFKRVYVNKGHGVIFFSGKNIGELDPSDKRYLSFSQHDSKIKEELTLSEGMLLVTCSGTVGNVAIVPKHWDGWAMTHDIIRIISQDDSLNGYLYAWLSSEWGKLLTRKYQYGAVVPHIEVEHLSKIPVPMLDEDAIDSINRKVLDANKLRYEAYTKEQEAMKALHENVLSRPYS